MCMYGVIKVRGGHRISARGGGGEFLGTKLFHKLGTNLKKKNQNSRKKVQKSRKRSKTPQKKSGKKVQY